MLVVNSATHRPVYNVSGAKFSQTSGKVKSYPKQSYEKDTVSFKGNPIKNLPEEYFKLLKQDGMTPLRSFLNLTGEIWEMDALLTKILKNKDTGSAFIQNIVEEQRNSAAISQALSQKVSANSRNMLTFLPDSPYRRAYEEYTQDRFNNATSVAELLKIRPDWKGEKLLEKHKMLTGNNSFELGQIPEQLPREHVFSMADYLMPFMQNGVKFPQKISGINLDGKRYEFEYFTDGKTDKNVFGIQAENGDKFILKMSERYANSLDNPFALGTLAKIDTFLTENKCRNSAPLRYYNHDKNFLIYDFIEHIPAGENSRNLAVIAEHIPDFRAFGLQFNDGVGVNNCFKLCENSAESLKTTHGFPDGVKNEEWISIDNDHVTFNNRLQPQIYEYHAPLPNAMQFCV